MKRGRGFQRRWLVEVLAHRSHGGEGTVEGPHHVGDPNLRGRGSKPEASFGAAAGDDQPGQGQLAQDLLEVGVGDLVSLADLVALGPVRIGAGQGQQRQASILAGHGEFHGRIITLLTKFVKNTLAIPFVLRISEEAC